MSKFHSTNDFIFRALIDQADDVIAGFECVQVRCLAAGSGDKLDIFVETGCIGFNSLKSTIRSAVID